jgi:hypothetical protein
MFDYLRKIVKQYSEGMHKILVVVIKVITAFLYASLHAGVCLIYLIICFIINILSPILMAYMY